MRKLLLSLLLFLVNVDSLVPEPVTAVKSKAFCSIAQNVLCATKSPECSKIKMSKYEDKRM